jgi:alpha-glucuronidase
MKFWRALAAVVVLTMMAGGIAMAQVVLAKDGKSLYRIVVPQKAIPSERYAAEELQRYLERISGAKLPIVTDSEPMGSHEILLGDNAHLRKLGIQVDFAKLGTDGFVLRTFQNHLIIAGGRPRGTLYGVYALLEEKLGVRWFTPEVEFVPKMERVELPVLNETQVPALEYREGLLDGNDA